jgi:hypothetical protein
MPRLCSKWQGRGGPLDAAGFKNKFPVLKIILPVSSPKFPVAICKESHRKWPNYRLMPAMIHAAMGGFW